MRYLAIGLAGLAIFCSAGLASALTIQNQDPKGYYIKYGDNEKPYSVKAGGSLEVPCAQGCRVRLVDPQSGKAIDMIEIPRESGQGLIHIRQQGFPE